MPYFSHFEISDEHFFAGATKKRFVSPRAMTPETESRSKDIPLWTTKRELMPEIEFLNNLKASNNAVFGDFNLKSIYFINKKGQFFKQKILYLYIREINQERD